MRGFVLPALMGVAILVLGLAMHLIAMAVAGAVFLAFTIEGAGRAFYQSLQPATKADRRLARSVERAVEQRMQAQKAQQESGAHAA